MNYYNKIANSYNELYGQEQLKKMNIIKSNIKISKSTKILDVGCGTGISSDFDCFIVGIDPSIKLLEQNNKLKILGIAEFLPFKDNSFDYVVSLTSIHNFKNIKKSINEIKRVGKANFILSILLKSKKFSFIKKTIEKNFKIEKIVQEDKDTIFLCQKLAKNISFIYRK